MKNISGVKVRLAAVALLACICYSPVAAQEKPFLPTVSGVLKTRFETDTENGDVRFNVNNARLGLAGTMVKAYKTDVKYTFQAELNAEGKLYLLDCYVTLRYGQFEMSVGQQLCRFGTELSRGPKLNYFANSSFVSGYVGSYYDYYDGSVRNGNFGARDIGVLLKYNNNTSVPIKAQIGLMNGSGMNNPAWRDRVNVVARLWLDENTALGGFGTALNYYTGTTPFGERITMAGGELKYHAGELIVEGEYANRWLEVTEDETDSMGLAALQAIYRIPVKGWGPIKFIAPTARWDYGHNMSIVTESAVNGKEVTHFNVQRATGGVTLGFVPQLLKCELRLNYEHYFFEGGKPAALASNPTFQNKFMVEFFLVF